MSPSLARQAFHIPDVMPKLLHLAVSGNRVSLSEAQELVRVQLRIMDELSHVHPIVDSRPLAEVEKPTPHTLILLRDVLPLPTGLTRDPQPVVTCRGSERDDIEEAQSDFQEPSMRFR